MAYVFISYSHDDLDYVDKLDGYLREAGLSVWLDRTDIRNGEKWKKQITTAIEECSAFVIVMSPNSLNSEWVNKELAHAEDLGKVIHPLLLAGECFPLLKDVQYDDVTGGQLPQSSFLIAVTGFHKGRVQTPLYSSAHRAADLRLLEDLWGLMGTETLIELREHLPVGNTSAKRFQETVIGLKHIRANKAEMRFLSGSIEEQFTKLDRLVQEFTDSLWIAATQVFYAGEARIIPDYMWDAFFPSFKMDAAEKHEKKRRFDDALSKLDEVIEQQQGIVRIIKQEFPEFRFETN